MSLRTAQSIYKYPELIQGYFSQQLFCMSSSVYFPCNMICPIQCTSRVIDKVHHISSYFRYLYYTLTNDV